MLPKIFQHISSYVILNLSTQDSKWYEVFLRRLRAIGLMSRVFLNGPGDRSLIPGQVIPKTQKMVLGATLLNTQHYKVMIKGKVELSREWSSALPYTSVQ